MVLASTAPHPDPLTRTSDAPVRIGVLGYGYWGPNLARNIATQTQTDLVAIADIDTRRLTAARNVHPIARLTTEFDELIDDPSLDAIAIATPAGTHYELAMRSLKAGKHVLITKPLATRVTHAAELVEAARQYGRHILVDHTFLFTGAVKKMKEYIDAGELGEIYYFDSTRINLGLFQHDANVIWDLAPHDISILLHLLGQPVRSVAAVGARHVDTTTENMAYVTLRFESNLLAHIHVNWLAPAKVRQTIIGGSKKMLVYDDVEASEKLKVYDSGADLTARSTTTEEVERRMVEYRTGDVLSPRLEKTEALAAEMAHFARVVRGEEEPLSSAELGLEVVRIIEAAQRSLRCGSAPVEVER
jgi:predicted dehydrogenase